MLSHFSFCKALYSAMSLFLAPVDDILKRRLGVCVSDGGVWVRMGRSRQVMNSFVPIVSW